MQPSIEGWGPTWKKDTSPSKNVMDLQEFFNDQSLWLNINITHTNSQQLKETLHYTALCFNQLIATKLGKDLTIWLSLHDNIVLLEKWHIRGLVDKFYHYPNLLSPQNTTNKINVFNRINDSNGYNKGEKFELKKKT